jgi:MtN3 and saliva related transmembrane protein
MHQPITTTQKMLASIAMMLSLVSYFPQLVRIIQRKSADDISYLFLAFAAAASLLWVAYAGLRRDTMMILAYIFGLMMMLLILALKFYYERFVEPPLP